MEIRVVLAWVVALVGMAPAAVYTYSGHAEPDSGSFTEPGNPAVNSTLFTTVEFAGTGWVAEDGFLKMTTSPVAGIYFGGWNQADPTIYLPGSPTDGNRLRVTSLLTAGSQHWGMQLADSAGNYGYMGFQGVGNGDNYPGVWVSVDGEYVQVEDESFNLNVLHTFEMHLFGDQVAYFIDGDEVIRGDASFGLANFYGVGDFSGSTPTGTGSMWVDYMSMDTAAGALPVPEPGGFLLLALGGISLFRRRR